MEARPAQQNATISWPGYGIMFFWQLGIVQFLQNFYDLRKCTMVGSSAGALLSVLAATNVDPQKAADRAYDLCIEHGVFQRPLGLIGVWGSIVRQWLQELLPEDAAERCNGAHVCIVLTTLPTLRRVAVSEFKIGNRQKDTLARLAAFTNKLRTTDQQENAAKKQQQQQQQQDLAKQAAALHQPTEAAEPAMQGQDKQPAAAEEAYDGKVREDIDHRSYMPAAWRVDDYLNQQDEDEDDLASLRQHKLEFAKAPGVDAMARSDNLDDYVVFDPLLETAKGKFSRAAQREKKKQTTWAGKGQG